MGSVGIEAHRQADTIECDALTRPPSGLQGARSISHRGGVLHRRGRAINEREYRHQAATEDGPGAPSDADIPRLEHVESGDRGGGQVPQFL